MEKDQNYSYSVDDQQVGDSNPKLKQDEISLKDIILNLRLWAKYLVSKWAIIIFAGVVGGVIGLIYSNLKKPVYQAGLSFALEDEQAGSSGLSGALGLASQFGLDLGSNVGGAFAGDNLLELMKSRSIVEKTLLTTVEVDGKKQTLAELYIDYNKLRNSWKDNSKISAVRFLPDSERSTFSLQQDSLLGEFHYSLIKENLAVEKTDKKLSIISVNVNSENELFSKYFAEELVKIVSDFYVETRTKKSTQNIAILQHQTDSVRRELNSAITGVAASEDINPNANPSRRVLRVPSQKRAIDVQANQAILTELVKNLELSKITLRKETPFIQIIDKPILPLKKEKIGKVKAGIIGFCIMSFITILFLVARKVYQDLMTNN